MPDWAKALIASLIVLALGAMGWEAHEMLSAHKAEVTQEATNTATAAVAQSGQQSAQDALKITVENQAVHGSIDVQTHEATNEILNAPGAGQAVDPAGNDTALRALCMFYAYQPTVPCRKLLEADSSQPEG